MATVEMKDAKRAEKRLAAKMKIATAMAEEQGRMFVPALTKEIARETMVAVKLPKITAKYLDKVPKHGLLVLEGDALNGVRAIDVPEHFVHKDFTTRKEDGSLRPTVFRHLFVHAEFLGETIPAKVTIQKKRNLSNGEESILINIVQIETEGNTVEVHHELSLGVEKSDAPGEVEIPGAPGRYIRISALKTPKKIADRITVTDKESDKPTESQLLAESGKNEVNQN
jgi:hypothetical protein